MLERLAQLSSIFTIEICAYAVMSNRYHLVLFFDQTKAKELTREEVVERWAALFGVPSSVARRLSGEALGQLEQLVRAPDVHHCPRSGP